MFDERIMGDDDPTPLSIIKVIDFLFLFGELKLQIVEGGDVRSEVVIKVNQERMEWRAIRFGHRGQKCSGKTNGRKTLLL